MPVRVILDYPSKLMYVHIHTYTLYIYIYIYIYTHKLRGNILYVAVLLLFDFVLGLVVVVCSSFVAVF